jgi:predicted aspartyl protease
MGFVYRYANESPPAPFVHVARPDGSAVETDLPGKVDTGADRTNIPAALAARLALDEIDRLSFAGFGGSELILPIYLIRLTIRDLPAINVEVAAEGGEQYVLLGRDVLNRYKIVLDGPNLRLEIG